MSDWATGERAICALLTGVAGLLLFLRLPARRARVAWIVLLALGAFQAVRLSLDERNLVNINVVHHYLGAKYPFSYSSCYRVLRAASEEPQVGMRDLQRPQVILRASSAEQRAYYLDLLRAEGVAFDPLLPLEDLSALAESSGALAREARSILAAELPADRIEEFRDDVRSASDGLRWERDIATDYGFNGSPFYALVRRVDPTLHGPFGARTALLNLLWQLAAALLVTWIVGAALDLELEGRLAGSALLFASWDFTGYALPGLVFAGVWLPLSLALLALRRRLVVPAGVALAWAGLVKLFPFVLLAPALGRVGVVGLRRLRRAPRGGTLRGPLLLLAACAGGALAFGLAGLASGRSWGEFLEKIGAQFQGGFLANGVGLTQWIVILGERGGESLVAPILAVPLLAVLGAAFAAGDDERFLQALPRRSLMLLAAVGLFTRTWLNYYAIAPLLLLPLLARRHRLGAASCAAGMALAHLLPDFDHPRMAEGGWLAGLKIAPYVLVPAWFLLLEIRGLDLGRRVRRASLAAALVAVLALAGEVLFLRHVHGLALAGGAALDRGDLPTAYGHYRELVGLRPGAAPARMDLAIVQAGLDHPDDAGASFAHAARLDPEDAFVRLNHGRWLRMRGDLERAAGELEAARRLSPHDPVVLTELALLEIAAGRTDGARTLLERAIELAPTDPRLRELLGRIGE